MDEILHHPNKPWNGDFPESSNKQWFPMVSKWCRSHSPQYDQTYETQLETERHASVCLRIGVFCSLPLIVFKGNRFHYWKYFFFPAGVRKSKHSARFLLGFYWLLIQCSPTGAIAKLVALSPPHRPLPFVNPSLSLSLSLFFSRALSKVDCDCFC